MFFFNQKSNDFLKKGKNLYNGSAPDSVMSHDYSELLSNGLQNEPNIFNDI